MEHKKVFFHITSVSRDDIAQCGYKDAEDIPDSVMEKIAEKMADSYVENQFWIDLECIVEHYWKKKED